MRKFHLLVVTGLVGAIVACLMVRTPNASATIETQPVAVVAQVDPIPESDGSLPLPAEAAPPSQPAAGMPPGGMPPGAPVPGLENGPPPNDPILNEALTQEDSPMPRQSPPPAAHNNTSPKPKKSLKDAQAFAQTPAKKPSREGAGMKSKKGSKKKTVAKAKHPKKKKKKS